LNEDRRDEMMSALITEMEIDPDTVELVVMPDGRIAVNDNTFGTPRLFIDPKKIEAAIESEILGEAPAGPLERVIRAAGESLVSTLSGAQGAAAESLKGPGIETVDGIVSVGGKKGIEGLGLLVQEGLISEPVQALANVAAYLFSDSDLEKESSSNNVVEDKYIIADKIQRATVAKVNAIPVVKAEVVKRNLPEEVKNFNNVKNNNPGNIKVNHKNKWKGAKKQVGTFEVFEDPIQGLRATAKVIDSNIAESNTFEEFVLRYAAEPSERKEFETTGRLPVNLNSYAKNLSSEFGLTSKDALPKDALQEDAEFKKFMSTLINQEGSGSLQ